MYLSSGRKPVHTTWPFKVTRPQDQHAEHVRVSDRGTISDSKRPSMQENATLRPQPVPIVRPA